jgi:hypothetical protein
MNRGPVIVLSGGLGNQLFQFSFAHLLVEVNGGKVTIYSPKPKNGAREFALHSLTDNCSHLDRLRLKRSWLLDIRFKFRGFIQHRFGKTFDKPLEKYFYSESNAYSFVSNRLSHKYYSGYFQNWRMVDAALPMFYSELNKALSEHSSSISEQLDSEPYGVVHFRRGDLLEFYQSMGVLEDDYFLSAIDSAFADLQKRIKLIVLTDHKEKALKSFADVADSVYGPYDVDEWEALRIMSRASFVVTSNSTFSWWGGLLAAKNGGVAYTPTPWFLNWTPDPGAAFEYPGFRNIPSRFKKEL